MAITDFLQEVDTKTENFRSNPRALAQAAQITEPTLEAVIARKVKKEKEAAFRDMAANVQIDPRKIAERDQQDIYAMTQNEAMQQANKLMARRQQSQDKRLRDFAANERGLMPLSRDIVRRNMGGGIAKFNTGVLVTDEQVEQLYQKLLKNPYRAQKATREEARSILEERAGKGLQPTAKNLIEGSVTARETPKGGLPALQKIPKSPVPTKFQGMTLTKEELEEKIKDVPQTGPGIMPPAVGSGSGSGSGSKGFTIDPDPKSASDMMQDLIKEQQGLKTLAEPERRTKSAEMQGISEALLGKTKGEVDPKITQQKLSEEERVLDLLGRDENKAALAGDIQNIEDFRRRQLDPEKIRDEELRAMLVGRSRSGIGGASMGLNLARRQQQEFEGNQLDNVFNKRKEAIASDVALAGVGIEAGNKVYDTLIKDQTASMAILADIDANEIKDINDRAKLLYEKEKDTIQAKVKAIQLTIEERRNEILADQAGDQKFLELVKLKEETRRELQEIILGEYPDARQVVDIVKETQDKLENNLGRTPNETELREGVLEALTDQGVASNNNEAKKLFGNYGVMEAMLDLIDKDTNLITDLENKLLDK
jgi:hypothetical protein